MAQGHRVKGHVWTGKLLVSRPFAELCPASIDPKVRAVTALRYRQAVEMATSLGISRLVIHSGFIPLVYFPEWFVEQSVVFWREFLREIPAGITIALENVMEPGPEMLVEIVRQVEDPRLGLCLDVGTPIAGFPRRPPWIGLALWPPICAMCTCITTTEIWIYIKAWERGAFLWRRCWTRF